MGRMVIVGAGIVGTMHAALAQRAGWAVTHLERDPEARSASVRNFGLVWVSGRAEGAELQTALRARALWEDVARTAPGVGFRPDGSLTVAQRAEEVAVLAQVAERADAAARGLRLLGPDQVRAVNPAVRGQLLAALHCTTDAVVEPRAALPALRGRMLADAADAGRPDRYRYLAGRIVAAVQPRRVVDHTGEVHGGDVVVLCTGAERQGPLGELLAGAPVRPVQLQMMQTAPLGERLATSLADGDSMRYYPAFRVPALASLPPQDPIAAAHRAQLLVAQRADGELTVGDTHAYEEPFDFAAAEAPYEHLRARAESILGRPLPPIVRRWTGVYAECTDGSIWHRDEVAPGVWVVTAPGGRGMTLAPAIAEDTVATIGGAP